MAQSVGPGEIKTREPLDRETKDMHELVLEARDYGTPSRVARVPLKVSVLDVNDNSPEIVDPHGDVISVREEQPLGTEVARVRAVDNDLGENASVTYTILKDRDSDGYNTFSIDPISGMIKTKVVLDHEERIMYRLSVKASDAGRPARHSVRSLRIEVLASADNRPTFTSSSLAFNVREDASIGQAVGSVSSAGPSGRVTYTLDSLHPLSNVPAFDVDRVSGQLLVAQLLDREDISEYQLEIRALDTTSIGNPQSIAVSVKINIEDVNDNAPQWPEDPIFIKISECALTGSSIYNLSATDVDDGPDGDLHYGLVAEYPPTGSFVVDSLTGALTLARPLDREECSEYTLVLKAEDRAPPSERLASTVTARISVLDENDNDPFFVVPISTKLSVVPDVIVGSALVRVIAVDKDAGDNGRISYIISSGNEEGYFSIGYESGLVSLVKPLQRSSELEITANDHGKPPRKATLKLIFTMAMGQSSGLPRLLHPNPVTRLSESHLIGAGIMNIAGPALHNQGNVTFSIPKGIASDKFGVTNSGMVILLAPLDHEESARYSVPVFARSSKLIDLTTLEIFVLDENDNYPEFRPGSCYTLALPENQQSAVVHSLVATDADEGKNGEISYSIIGGNVDSKFKLDPITGALSATSLDREVVSKYVLTISAKDKGHHSLQTRCNLTVIVLDVNDNAPIFLHNQYSDSKFRSTNSSGPGSFKNDPATSFNQGKYSTTVSEDIAPDSSIMQLRATDPDQGVNGKITYSISEESTWLFRIDNLTGVITTAGSLDRERESFYSFFVVATDCSKYETRQSSVPVEIYISDVNDNQPVFEEYPFHARVPRSTQPGQNILKVKATDADDRANGEIVYVFSHMQDKPMFRIHPNTGMVTVTSSLTEENGRVYRLEVFASDKGHPPLSTRGLVELHIGDPSYLAPVLKFQNDNYHVTLQENSAVGTEIIQVTAVRSDGRRQRIVYSIGSGNDQQVFDIDEETGILKVNDSSKLDAELYNDTKSTETSFTENRDLSSQDQNWTIGAETEQVIKRIEDTYKFVLTLVAKTVGVDQLEAYTKLGVRISDANDNAPIFTQSQYSATVLEGNVKGDFVVKLSANDMDQGLNSKLLYHIVDGNPDNAFTISPPYSGVVRTNIVLDREIREKYRLTIIATDQGNPQLTGTAALSIRVIDINDNQPTFPEHKVVSVPEESMSSTVL